MSTIGLLSASVHREIARLKGHIPADFEPREWTVNTPIGPHPIPPSMQALLAVKWPEGHVLHTDDDLDWDTRLPSHDEVGEGLIVDDAAWYTIGWDEGQWYHVVDLADDSDDPWTFYVDHEGGERRPGGVALSERLRGLSFRVEEAPDHTSAE